MLTAFLIALYVLGWIWAARRIAWLLIDDIIGWHDVDTIDYFCGFFCGLCAGWAWPVIAPFYLLYLVKGNMGGVLISAPRSHRLKIKEEAKRQELRDREQRIEQRERECAILDARINQLERKSNV
jgi:hypothetical protein